MNEEQNIHDDQTVPTTAVNNEPSSQNEESNSQTEPIIMEVHTHTHHAAHKKKWGIFIGILYAFSCRVPGFSVKPQKLHGFI
jgi:hypothetical protein